MNQFYEESIDYKVPSNQDKFSPAEKVARLFAVGSMDSFTPSNEPVVVIIPSGSYNEPRELGRYKNLQIAAKIIAALALTEFRLFSLESGEEIFLLEDILH